MKKKFKVTLAVFLVIILGCFSQVFAATKQNSKLNENVRIIDTPTDDDGVIGTSNLNDTIENSAKIGDQLASPEIGWKRYNDTNKNIWYIGNWILWEGDSAKWTQGTAFYTDNVKDECKFNFTGTKIRLVSEMDTNHSRNISVKIDGVEVGPFSENGSNKFEILLYENTKLDNGEHYVEITNNDTEQLVMDAIDIDRNDTLNPYDTLLVHNLKLNYDMELLTTGQVDTLTATITPNNAKNKTLTWKSSNPSIAIVDKNGHVKALKVGRATITATTTDGSNVKASCVIDVLQRAKGITLNKSVDDLLVGEPDNLVALVTPRDATLKDVKWISSDPSIVTVDDNGKITAIKTGTATITATVQDGRGLHAQCRITVE